MRLKGIQGSLAGMSFGMTGIKVLRSVGKGTYQKLVIQVCLAMTAYRLTTDLRCCDPMMNIAGP